MFRPWMTAALAVVLIAGCDEEPTALRDVIPPAAPRGVYSVTGDRRVDIHWLANTEGDVAGYKVYEAPCARGQSCPYDLVGVTAGTSFGVTGLANGATRYFAVAAYDRAGNESALSPEDIYDTPRPAGYGLILAGFGASPATSGYDFSAYVVRPYDNQNADIFFGYSGTIYQMFAAFNDVLIQDAGYTHSLDEVDFAPTAGWSANGTVELIEGHSYVAWMTLDNHFAKFRVVSLTPAPARAVIDWAYQVDAGNRELVARPAALEGGRVRRPVVWLR